MKLLTIDSSEKQAVICLKTDKVEIIDLMDETKSHSEFLLQEIENLLCENNLTINDIDNLSVNVGPGSFTGIRIGISFVKAFMSVKKYNTVVVNNFELISENIENKTKEYFVLFNSNNDEFYYANFVNDKISYGYSNYENFNKNINKNGNRVYCDIFQKSSFEHIESLNCVIVKQDSMLKCTVNKIDCKSFSSINEISPLYIKKSQAEQGLQQKINDYLEIREKTTLEELIVLENKCFYEEAYSEKLLKEDLDNNNRKMYYAYYNNELIGYIDFDFVLDELDLLKICVLPEFRQYKIATKLMEKMINFAKNNKVNSLFLEVDCKNISAIKLYEKLNFKQIDCRKKYYKNGNDALIYKLVP